MTRPRRLLAGDAGLTLVELLLTISIMGIAFLAILGGMGTSILTSDIHRKQATGQTLLTSFAEAVKEAAYVDCAQASDYQSSFTAPAGYGATVTAVAYWLPPPSPQAPPGFGATCPPDTRLQQVSLEIRSTDGRATETVAVFKRKA